MRDVRESATFTAQAALIFETVRRRDERMFGLITILSNKPEIGTLVPNTDMRAILCHGYEDGPDLMFFYSFTSTLTFLEGVMRVRTVGADDVG
jgi:hypothetical protein